VAGPAAGVTHAQRGTSLHARHLSARPDNDDVFRELVVKVPAAEVKILTLKR
jgi:hypothetical protein